ncbi:AfsR/SARP family transcriptional regulator, partial [Kitasatospora sp. NPDC002522]
MTISSHKARALLACLALDLNRPVSAAVLAERLWDDQPPPSAAGTLQSYVSKLRTVLREANARAAAAGAPPVELASRRGTYQLNARPDQVDWQLYLRLGKEARHLAETGADRQALEAFARAQDLWQGEPLAGLPGVWPQLTRTTMYDQWLATTAARVELELRLGRFADLVPELAPLVEQRPQDERLAGQLMTALYGSGRQAEALALFRDTSRRIRADHGTEPAEPLRRLHERMLRGAPVSALLGRSGPPREGQPAGRTGRAPSKLPPAPVLEGRGAELRSLVECARVR